MSSKRKANRKCKCGQPGTYRYSIELTQWLKIHPWVGVYRCDKCFRKINKAWLEAQETSDDVEHD